MTFVRRIDIITRKLTHVRRNRAERPKGETMVKFKLDSGMGKTGPEKYMSKREYRQLVFMIFLAVVFITVIFIVVLNTTGNEETTTSTAEGVPIKYRSASEMDDQKEKAREVEKHNDMVAQGLMNETQVPAEPWKPDPAIWTKVKDMTVGYENTEVFFHLLHRMNTMSDQELENQAITIRGGLYQDIYNNPNAYRGKIIEVTGRLLEFHRRELDNQALIEKTGVDHVWAAVVANSRLETFQVYFLERRPGELGVLRWGESGDVVRFRAAFWKIHSFINYNDRERQTFLLVGKSLEKVPDVKIEQKFPVAFTVIVAVIALLTGGFIFFLVIRDSKKSRDFSEKFRSRHPRKISNEEVKKHVVNPPEKPADDKTP